MWIHYGKYARKYAKYVKYALICKIASCIPQLADERSSNHASDSESQSGHAQAGK
jgi:hypothetical protein